MRLVELVKKCYYIIVTFITTLTVEPIAFFDFMSFQLFHVAHHTGLYEVICLQHFPNGNKGDGTAYIPPPSHGGQHAGHRESRSVPHSNHSSSGSSHHFNPAEVDCRNLKHYHQAEIIVQESMSEWNMYFSLAHILPAMLAHVFLGALGDKHGRKTNILIGITGLVINVVPFLVVFEFPQTPLWILVVTGFVAGLTGYMGIIMISAFAYLADIIPKKEDLTIRMVIFTVIRSISGVIGSLLAAFCLKYLKYSTIGVITLGLLTLSFFYSLIRLKQVPPAEMRKMHDKEKSNVVPLKALQAQSDTGNSLTTTNVEPAKTKMSIGERIKTTLKMSWKLLIDVYRTYCKPRPGRQRLYLLLTAAIFFVHLLANMGMHVTSLYVFRSPIGWNGEQLAYFKAATNIIHFVGNIIGIAVMKKVLKLNDTTILLVALSGHVAQEFIVAFANSTWMMYLAMVVGSLNPLFMPTVKSFVTQMVDVDEVGKSFVMFGLAFDIGAAISSVASNAIYKATVHFLPGFVFLLCGGFLVICFLLILFIHIDIAQQKGKHDQSEKA